MHLDDFTASLSPILAALQGQPVTPALGRRLHALFPPQEAEFQAVAACCRQGVAAGWLANRQAGGIRYGRALKAGPLTAGFSVDVVEMADIAGPFHAHPLGEIDMIMPLDPGATFDGHAAGWLVYGPETRHAPTVRGGRAIVLYLLPEGRIDFAPPT